MSKKNYFKIVLLLLVATAGWLRFYNVNWDQGLTFHPDERNIDAAVSRINFSSNLDPGFFAYGGFTIYLYRATGEVVSFLTKDPTWLTDWGKINIIGRSYSAFFSTLTVVAVYFLGKKLFNKKVALVSTFVTAFSANLIQVAHIGVTESFITAMAITTVFYSLKLYENPTLKNYLRVGVLFGIAVAAKTSSLSFIPIFLTAHFLATIKKPLGYQKFIRRNIYFLVLLISALATFTIFSPYTFLNWNKFIESMHYESGVVTGTLDVPYTIQFTNTAPYLFQLKNLYWQMGPVFILGILGFIVLVALSIKKRKPSLLIFLSFPIGYFSYVGSWHTKFVRYIVPIIPFLAIFASYFLYIITKKTKPLGVLLLLTSLTCTLFWGMAYFSVYTKEQTRISASNWMYTNIPEGSKILTEHWDDGLPVNIKNKNHQLFEIEQLTMYEPDNAQKLIYLADKLIGGEYIVLSTRRLWGTLINLETRYPITSKYYKLLFDEKLGYEKVSEFSSYPELFGYKINDDSAEETVQVYDHPTVIIFAKNKNLEKQTYIEMLSN